MSEYSERIGGYKSIYERLAVAETQSSVAKRVSNSPLHENKSIDSGTSSSYFNFRSSSPSPSQRSIQPSLSSSSRMVVSPKIFDRLASTETYASAKLKGKIKDEKRSSSTPRKTSMAFFARLAYTETFASAQMKGLIDAAAKKEPRSSSRARSVRSTQSEARGESFWDRMSKTETYASMTLKGKLSPTSKQHQQQQQQSFYVDPRASLRHNGGSSSSVRSAVSPSARSISSRSSSRKGPVPSSFFDRLSKAQTISSLQKTRNHQGNQQGQRSKTPDAARMFHNSNRSVYSSDARLPPSAAKARKSLYNGGSNASVASSQKSPRSVRTTSPSTRSVGTARTTKSVATTRSVTTSKSLGNSTIDTLYTMSSAYSTSYRKTSRQSASLAPKKSSTSSSSSSSRVATVAQPRRLPPPSPKTTRLGTSGKPLTRDHSSSPRALSMRQRTSTFTTSSYARTAAATKAAATTAPVKSAPKPTPPPRPVLKFDDDDDELSFGSEGSDEASLGPSSVSKAPHDAGSVASKSMASKKSTSSAIAELTATTEAEMASVGLNDSPTEDTYALRGGDEGVRDREMSFARSVSNDGEESMGHQMDEKSADTFEQQGEENIDEYLDSIEKQSADEYDDEDYKDSASPDSREMEETMESKPKSNPRIAVVHESDDELSFGSDEGEDEWMNGHENGKDDSVASKDASHDAEEIAVDDNDEHDAEESNKDDHDFNSEQIIDSIDNIDSHDYKEGPSESMEEEEERSYMSDAHSTKTPEATDEISMTDQHDNGSQGSFAEEDQGIKGDDEEESVSYGNSVNVEEKEEEEIVEEDSVAEDADHVEYDNEDGLDYGESDREDEFHVDAQHIEEEYDEEDDLEQMDSLDLILDATKSKDSKFEREEHIVDEEEEFDDKIVHGAQELQCKYKIFKTEKYHPEYGVQEVNPDDLYLKETLECFERGEISNEEIAVLIIEALFELDFSHGDHWEIDDGTARELEEDEGGGGDLKGRAFAVKRQARLDWNDLYSVAASKGTVVVVPEKNEIRVENYSYFVAG